jgi:hypothetical protein
MTFYKIHVTDDNINNININKYKFLNLDDFIKLNNDEVTNFNLLLIRANYLPIVKTIDNEFQRFFNSNNTESSIKNKIINCKIPKVLFIHDIHEYSFIGGYKALFDISKELNINYVISNFSDNFEFEIIHSNFEKLNIPVFVFPIFNIAFQDDWVPDSNISKEYDILYYGADIDPCYHFRLRLKKILEKYSKIYGWKIRIVNYGELTGTRLYNEINKSFLCVSTRSSFDYFLFKYCEIPFSNSLVIGDIPTQLKDYLKNNTIIEINENMSDSVICTIINDTLKDKNLIIEKTKKLQDDIKYLNAKYLNHYLTLMTDIILNK